MDNCHAVVWIDHRNAEIIKFNRSESETEVVKHDDAPKTIHHKAGTMGSGHVYEDDSYLRAVADEIRDAREILITGPGHVKWQLKAFLGVREAALARRIASVETVTHPTDGELLVLARKYFVKKDKMLPQ